MRWTSATGCRLVSTYMGATSIFPMCHETEISHRVPIGGTYMGASSICPVCLRHGKGLVLFKRHQDESMHWFVSSPSHLRIKSLNIIQQHSTIYIYNEVDTHLHEVHNFVESRECADKSSQYYLLATSASMVSCCNKYNWSHNGSCTCRSRRDFFITSICEFASASFFICRQITAQSFIVNGGSHKNAYLQCKIFFLN